MGLFVSSISHNERKAALATVFAVLAPTLVPAVILYLALVITSASSTGSEWELTQSLSPLLLFNPGFSFGYVFLPQPLRALVPVSPALGSGILDVFYTVLHAVLPSSWSARIPIWTGVSPIVLNVICVQLLSWAALFRAALMLPHVWKDRPRRKVTWQDRWERFSQGNAETRQVYRTGLLKINPFYWLVARDRFKPHYAWFFLLAMILVWTWRYINDQDVMFDFYPLVPTIVLIHTFLKVWVIAESSQRLIEDQRSGALELLLSTPLAPRQIVEGQLLALKRQFALPVLALCLIELGVFSTHYSPATILLVQAMLIADLLTSMWISMWLALSARSLNHVMLLAMGLVLIIPWVIFVMTLGILEQFPTVREPSFYSPDAGGYLLLGLAWGAAWMAIRGQKLNHVPWLATSFSLGLLWCIHLIGITVAQYHLRRANARWDIPFDQRVFLWFLTGMAADLFLLCWTNPKLLKAFRAEVLRRFDKTPGAPKRSTVLADKTRIESPQFTTLSNESLAHRRT